jgi:hypothetical protein
MFRIIHRHAFLLIVFFYYELFLFQQAFAQPSSESQITTSVYITSIIINGIVRMGAIAAGTYIVWLGHSTLIRGIKGEFEFSGRFGRLKGSAPGLLFVFLGTLAVGWALSTTHSGGESIKNIGKEGSSIQGTSIPPEVTMPSLPPRTNK